jgi:Concanavalin A-like lectin/glucanases superfamily
VEVFFKAAPGQSNGTLIQKMSETGWRLAVNNHGGVSMFVKGGLEVKLASRRSVSDGRWHHLLAELDRKQSRMSIYLDGETDSSVEIGPQSNLQGSLANDADLYVGGTPQGDDFNGVIDFMRIARGTLADSKTTIQELYAWEFQGPFLDDFAGRHRNSGAAAGALAK